MEIRRSCSSLFVILAVLWTSSSGSPLTNLNAAEEHALRVKRSFGDGGFRATKWPPSSTPSSPPPPPIATAPSSAPTTETPAPTTTTAKTTNDEANLSVNCPNKGGSSLSSLFNIHCPPTMWKIPPFRIPDLPVIQPFRPPDLSKLFQGIGSFGF